MNKFLSFVAILAGLTASTAHAFKVGGENWVSGDGAPGACLKTDGAGNLGWLLPSATSPMLYNAATGVISEQVCTSTQDGYLSHTDWNTFNGKQNALTFGNLTVPGIIFSLTGGTGSVIGSGTSFSLLSQSANTVFAAPNGSSGTPSFRTLVGADLPAPSATTLGGVKSAATVSHQWVNSISTAGLPALSQPAFADISGVATGAQLPNPSSSTLGGVQSAAAVSHQWVNSISTLGVPALSQPAFSDVSGTASLTSQVTGILPTANGGTGQNSTATFPASGTVLTDSNTATVTNKSLLDTTTNVANATDASKTLKFDLSGATTAKTLTVAVPVSSNVTYTIPASAGNDTFTMTGLPQVLFSKGLATGTNSSYFRDSTDSTKKLQFALSPSTTGTTLTINGNQTTTQTIDIPNVGASDAFVTKNATAALTNKTIGDSLKLSQIATPSDPGTGNTSLYSKSDGKLYYFPTGGAETAVGAGAGGGVKNYISSNPDAETNTAGWVQYADTAKNIPTTGAGTSGTSFFARTTSSPLRGVGSFQITKPATNRQGEGVSYAFTIDSADKAKTLSITYDFNANGLTVSDGRTAPLNDGTTTTNAGNSDVETFVYDVTNAALIPVSPQVIAANGSNNFTFKGTFQTASNSTSYRLIYHIASSNAAAWTFTFDNVVVGPQSMVNGAPLTDWVSYIPVWTSSGTQPTIGNGSISGEWRREGDSIRVRTLVLSGSTTTYGSGTYYFSLPAGISIDTNKINASTGSRPTFGNGFYLQLNGGSNHWYATQPAYETATTFSLSVDNADTSGTASVGASFPVVPTASTASQEWRGDALFPVSGWGSTVQMSSDTDTRIVAARYHGVTTTAFSTTPVNWKPDTKDYDTHGAFNTSTGQFTVPVSGYYRDSFTNRLTNGTAMPAGVNILTELFKNNSMVSVTGALYSSSSVTPVQGSFWSGTDTVFANAGDTLEFRVVADSGSFNLLSDAASPVLNYVTFERVTGPATMAAADSVGARYTTTASPSIASGSTPTAITFGTKDYDSASGYSGSLYTVATSGKYLVASSILYTSAAWTQGNLLRLLVYKNGVQASVLYITSAPTTGTYYFGLSGSDEINCMAGDTLEIRSQHGESTNRILDGGSGLNHVIFRRIGN